MTDEMPRSGERATVADAADRAELAAHIDALMSLPPRPRPSIIVVGDDVVFGITPPPRPN